MSVISDLLNQIKTAVYGKDVRQAIHDAIQQCYLDSAEGITPVITTETVSGGHNIKITVGADTTTVFVANGQNGQNGTNGENGQNGQDGTNGVGSLPDGTYTAQEIHTSGTLTSSGTYVIFFIPFVDAVNRTITITPTKISVRDRGNYLANSLTAGVTYEYVLDATGILVKAIKSDGWGGENNSVVSVQFTFDLTVEGSAQDISESLAQIQTNKEDIDQLKADLDEIKQGSTGNIPTNVRRAMFTLFDTSAYAEAEVNDELAILRAWAEEVTSISLNQTAISISGINTVQLVATTEPVGKTVVWSSSDSSIAIVNDSGLVSGVSNGMATITASCGDKRAVCSVTVSGFATLVSISAVYTQSGTVYAKTSIDDLKSDLVVTGNYDNGTTATITDYTLSGTLTDGTSTVTVTFGRFSTTFSVIVSPPAPLYTLYQGSGTDSVDNTLTITNNTCTFVTKDNSRKFYVTDRIIRRYNIGDYNFFSLDSGDSWELKVKNISYNYAGADTDYISINVVDSSSNIVFGSGHISFPVGEGTLQDVSVTGTIESDVIIGGFYMLVYRSVNLNCDVELYINGTRYI